jgi:hypothetical protein
LPGKVRALLGSHASPIDFDHELDLRVEGRGVSKRRAKNIVSVGREDRNQLVLSTPFSQMRLERLPRPSMEKRA